MVRPGGPHTATNLFRHESEVGSLPAQRAAGVLVSVLWPPRLLRPPVLLWSGVSVLLWPLLLSSPPSWDSRPVTRNRHESKCVAWFVPRKPSAYRPAAQVCKSILSS